MLFLQNYQKKESSNSAGQQFKQNKQTLETIEHKKDHDVFKINGYDLSSSHFLIQDLSPGL